MKLRSISEGMIDQARSGIVGMLNRQAGRIAAFAKSAIRSASVSIDDSAAPDEPAVVTIRFGRSPETMALRLFGDGRGEIKLETSQRLAGLLKMPTTTHLNSVAEAEAALAAAAASLTDRLEHGTSANA